MKHFNELTPAETERIALLIEGCAEVQHISCKILRHGYESYNPYDENKITNRHLLEEELGHLELAIEMICGYAGKDLDNTNVRKHYADKAVSISSFLHHQNLNQPISTEER